MGEVALPAIAQTPATRNATFAFLFHSATAITSARPLACWTRRMVWRVGEAYARTARLRFSSATRGRFCWGAGVEIESSIAGGISEGEVGASSAGQRDTREEGEEQKVTQKSERQRRLDSIHGSAPHLLRFPPLKDDRQSFGNVQWKSHRKEWESHIYDYLNWGYHHVWLNSILRQI